MRSRKKKTFSSAIEVFRNYFSNAKNDKDSVSVDRYVHTDYDFPKRLANNFRSAIEGKKDR